jgi:hypothetical protein
MQILYAQEHDPGKVNVTTKPFLGHGLLSETHLQRFHARNDEVFMSETVTDSKKIKNERRSSSKQVFVHDLFLRGENVGRPGRNDGN